MIGAINLASSLQLQACRVRHLVSADDEKGHGTELQCHSTASASFFAILPGRIVRLYSQTSRWSLSVAETIGNTV